MIVGFFAVDRLARLWLARDRRWYFKHHWLDFALLAAVPLIYIAALELRGTALNAGMLYLVTTQVYILATLVIRAVELNLRLSGSGIPPAAAADRQLRPAGPGRLRPADAPRRRAAATSIPTGATATPCSPR